MDKKAQKRISKRLSLHLRHDPAALDLRLEPKLERNIYEPYPRY